MKLKDSDLIHEYNATKRLGNPSTAAAGDAKELRENMHDTTKATSSIVDRLLEQDAYKEFTEHFADIIVNAEETLNAERIVEGILSVIQEQQKYHSQKVQYYTNIFRGLE